MKYYAVRFTSSSGSTEFYTKSKDGKKYLTLDHNRELLTAETDVQDIMNKYDVYSVIYVGKTSEKALDKN